MTGRGQSGEGACELLALLRDGPLDVHQLAAATVTVTGGFDALAEDGLVQRVIVAGGRPGWRLTVPGRARAIGWSAR